MLPDWRLMFPAKVLSIMQSSEADVEIGFIPQPDMVHATVHAI